MFQRNLLNKLSYYLYSKIFTFVIFTLVLFVSLTNYLVNPYSYFEDITKDAFPYKSHIDSERMTNFYKALHAKPKSLMMGTSRIGHFLTSDLIKYLPQPIYNMSLPGSTIDEQSQYLEFMIKHQNIKTIIWSLDFFSFNPDKKNYPTFKKERLTTSFYSDDFMLSLFSFPTFKKSILTIKDNQESNAINIENSYRHTYTQP